MSLSHAQVAAPALADYKNYSDGRLSQEGETDEFRRMAK